MKNLLLSAAMLLPVTALAAPSGVTLTQNKAITVFHGKAGPSMPGRWNPPAGKTKIFDTLGKGHTYLDNEGWTISNPGSDAETLQWFAYAIVPKTSGTITEIVEGIGYVTGTEAVTIALLADNNGSPGKVLQQNTVKKLETFGDCCKVAVDRISAGIPVTAGTTYWVAAILPKKKESATWDAWNFSSENTGSGTAAYYNGTWNVTDEEYAAFAVYGD